MFYSQKKVVVNPIESKYVPVSQYSGNSGNHLTPMYVSQPNQQIYPMQSAKSETLRSESRKVNGPLHVINGRNM